MDLDSPTDDIVLESDCTRTIPWSVSESQVINLEKKVREKSRECHNHAAALPRHQEEDKTDKTKQAQIEQMYEKH